MISHKKKEGWNGQGQGGSSRVGHFFSSLLFIMCLINYFHLIKRHRSGESLLTRALDTSRAAHFSQELEIKIISVLSVTLLLGITLGSSF